MLVDTEIIEAVQAHRIELEPREGFEARVQPASLDVRLGNSFKHLNRHFNVAIDPREDLSQYWVTEDVADGEHIVLHPGELFLAATKERIGLPTNMVARVEGKSSLGRLGVLVHATAGFIDPGWPLASITLEISTVIGFPVKLYPGMPIAQLAFENVSEAQVGYSGKYVGQPAPTPSKYHHNWTGTRWI